MSLVGTVANLMIKSLEENKIIRQLEDVTLKLRKSETEPTLRIIPDDDADECTLELKDCVYVKDSSTPGRIDCILSEFKGQVFIIMDKEKKCGTLLEYLRQFLSNKPKSNSASRQKKDEGKKEKKTEKKEEKRQNKSEESSDGETFDNRSDPVNNEKVNDLIEAFNQNDANRAARIAEELAKKKTPIRFSMDLYNESGNSAPREPPKPVVKPFELKMTIESFQIEYANDTQFNVAILPNTSIKDLKQLVNQKAGIPVNQQYWYIIREYLPDDYIFGKSTPRINENTVLTLFISKPQEP